MMVGVLATSREVAFSPVRFFSRLPTNGGYVRPLAFALVWGLFAFAAGGFWNFVVPGNHLEFFLATLIASPIVVLTNLTLVAAVAHLFFVRRSLGGESAGFGATFRVCCYASVANILCAVPLLGFFAAGVWFIFLVAAGLGQIHFEKATFVRIVGLAYVVGAFVAFAILKLVIVGVLYSSLVGIALVGTPAGSGEADSDVLLAIVAPASGAAYDY
jgi:hypothetical protein